MLDPAQNHSFRDHYLDVELDLSQVMFLATANVADTIPGPLLDRMEVISFDGYTTEEKLAIAKGYLWPRQRDRNGLREDEVEVSDELLRTSSPSTPARQASATSSATSARFCARRRPRSPPRRRPRASPMSSRRRLWTSRARTARLPAAAKAAAGSAIEIPVKIDLEAVRDALGRQKFFQESATRTATPGVATGLAVTGVGGDVLFIESTAMKGGSSNGSLVLTGQLGDVMKESGADRPLLCPRPRRGARASTSTSSRTGSSTSTCPPGRCPRTARAPGVTMVTSLASLLSGRPVKHTVGMTGEVTLQGKVLPIGGLKQKVLAAHAAGLTDVILPERNRGDLDDIPEEVREQMTFHPVMTVQEVLDRALEPARDVAHA